MKPLWIALLVGVAMTGCQSSISDAKTPQRNNAATDYSNVINENQARDHYMFAHGNAARPCRARRVYPRVFRARDGGKAMREPPPGGKLSLQSPAHWQ